MTDLPDPEQAETLAAATVRRNGLDPEDTGLLLDALGLSHVPEPPEPESFGGETYDPAQDHDRLSAQLRRVWLVVRDGRWRTLAEISELTGDPEASVSARLRDLRKPKFGGYQVSRQRRGYRTGLHEYRVEIQPQTTTERAAS